MSGIKARLSTMMFLEFFVWGAWYTTVAVYMAAEGLGDLTHWPYTVNPRRSSWGSWPTATSRPRRCSACCT